MKQDKKYEKVIETLKRVKPIPEKPQELTDQIMDQLYKHQARKRKGINISDNAGQWNIFIGFRTVAATAAVFLIGFFVLQQWEIMSKVSSLEEEVNNQKYTPVTLDQVDGLKASYLKTVLEQQVKLKKVELTKSRDRKEHVTINRNSLNQLILLVEQMEEENRILKGEILKQFADTLKKRPIDRIKSL